MSDINNVVVKVVEILAEYSKDFVSGGNTIEKSTDLAALKLDSLDTVEMIMEIEKEFGVSIDDETAQKFKTVGEIVDFILENRKLDAKL